MLKLNAGFSRKVGEANFGSRGASVNVVLEVESGLIGDADALMDRIRKLFTIAKRAVDSELAGRSGTAGASHSYTPAMLAMELSASIDCALRKRHRPAIKRPFFARAQALQRLTC